MDTTGEIRKQELRGVGSSSAAHEEDHRSDAELLHLFVERRDEQAIAALVARHGPLVMGLCRNMLRNEQDSADAFQATFLVLLKRAATIRKPASLASWLHGVACRVALRARAEAKRRQKHERLKSEKAPEALSIQPERGETITLIHLELQKLPERFRLPVILCCLEGVSRDEAARRLGWTVGSLKGRLERGREMLRLRLARHGLIFSAAMLSTLMAEQASAEVPAAVFSSTIKATILVAGEHSLAGHAISSQSLVLTEGVLKAMFITKLKTIAALLLVGCGLVSGAWAFLEDRESRQGERQPIIVREDGGVRDLAWSADGSVVVAISEIFELAEPEPPQKPLAGNVQKLIEGERPQAPALTFHMNVKLLDAKTAELLKEKTAALVRTVGAEKYYISAIAVSPDKKHAAIAGQYAVIGRRGGAQYFVKLCDAQTWALVQELRDDDAVGVGALAFSPDGKALAMGGINQLAEDGSFVKLWDVEADEITSPTKFAAKSLGGGIPVRRKAPEWRVEYLAFSPDGTLLASGESGQQSHRARVRLCDAATGVSKRELDLGESKGPVSIAFADGGKSLVSACGAVKSWNVQTGDELRTFGSQGWESFCVAVSHDGRHVAAAGRKEGGDSTRLWDAKTGELKQTLRWQTPGMFTSSLAFSPDGRSLAVGGQTGADLGEKGELKLVSLD
ncbi:MAG TPA: sigma-70 family RNA polymerase sigma factor [Pirellulales bacterium]|jgi:RNA polymerase sigma factor (sigma-70 family)|nr:sigma-70 family RNA polymerase sigma factor [Pirellulales bacterium]